MEVIRHKGLSGFQKWLKMLRGTFTEISLRLTVDSCDLVSKIWQIIKLITKVFTITVHFEYQITIKQTAPDIVWVALADGRYRLYFSHRPRQSHICTTPRLEHALQNSL
jgi:hypothetical protein